MTPHRYDNGEAYARIRKAVQAHGRLHTREEGTIEGVTIRNVYTGQGTGVGSHRAWFVGGERVDPCGDISHVVDAIIAAKARNQL